METKILKGLKGKMQSLRKETYLENSPTRRIKSKEDRDSIGGIQIEKYEGGGVIDSNNTAWRGEKVFILVFTIKRAQF